MKAKPTTKTAKATIRAKTKTPRAKARPVIVCTEFRGVFFGYAENTKSTTVFLTNARMCLEPGTKFGIMQLAETGPTERSRISARADIEVRQAIAVMEVKPAAALAWESKESGWQ